MHIKIGIDESGKGDFFGGLSIAAVLIAVEKEKELKEAGVKDCKKLSEKKIFKLENLIKEISKYSVVYISPKRYNELHLKMGSINKILAWGHARALENVLKDIDVEEEDIVAISDKFGDEKWLKRALMKKGRKIKLLQIPKAEEEICVASASILARAEFLRRFNQLIERYGIEFKRGATFLVTEPAREFIKRYGKSRLIEVAKVHFSIFNRL